MRLRRSHIAAFHDIIMAASSFVLALYLRLGLDNFYQTYDFIVEGTLLFTVICAIVFSALHLYRGVWRYASTQDLIAITKAATLSVIIFIPLMFLVNRLDGMPRSVLIINWLVLMAFLGGPRFLYRIIKDHYFMPRSNAVDTRIPVLLAGVNSNAELFLRETCKRGVSEYKVVGLLDNDLEKIGRHIYNIRIYGDFTVIPRVIAKLKSKGQMPQKILLTSNYVAPETARNMLKIADSLGISLARLPRLSEFKKGVDKKIQLQPLALEDLLGRPQNVLDRPAMQALIQNKHILVTGAGGTIGSELVRQITGYNPAHITLVEMSEYNLYSIDQELNSKFPDIKHRARIVDIRDRNRLSRVFLEAKPDIVFHAAALKHVPLVEHNPMEAILTNILGTKNVADCCLAHNISEMVFISTDKAVNPTNIMGSTKRMAECYLKALGAAQNGRTRFITVRFGNVLGSSGSVIPLFQSQLEQGGPLTVTHPDIERYFMTVREAVELVLQASTLSDYKNASGSIFVLDMGAPVKIQDLAKQMIRLAGLHLGKDIEIEYVGLRPGEKLKEELFLPTESLTHTCYDNISLATSDALDINILNSMLAELFEASRRGDIVKVRSHLKKLLPEYQPPVLAA